MAANNDKMKKLQAEIVDIIFEHSDYIEAEPMAFFYCLYFCIYFKNETMVSFLNTLIKKSSLALSNPKIEVLIKHIEEYGLERLRTVGENINTYIYHLVFYQSMDDDLRICYSQIIRKLKFIQMRDLDAVHLLKTRDYILIKETFTKFTTKMKIKGFTDDEIKVGLKSRNYRKYNQAFYEELLIDYRVEARVA